MSHRRLIDVIGHFARCAPEQLAQECAARLAVEPRCPITHYLLGCQGFDRRRSATAVRHLMIAHHAAPGLQSAALLVFAGLNWISRHDAPFLSVLLETWEEFRRPTFDHYPLERRLLDAFARPDPGLELVAPLARRLWRLPIRTLRAQIEAAVRSRDTRLHPQLIAPA